MSPTPKKIRSQPPDVIVAVGEGESMQEFPCYKIALSFASPYFDTMLSVNMAEGNTGRIEFPNKDPEEWKLFYSFIDPENLGGKKEYNIDDTNVMLLTKYFHEFEMELYLKECDNVLTKQVDALSMRGESGLYDKLFWDRNYPNFDTENLTERTSNFNEIIRLLQFATMYDLEKTKLGCENLIGYLMYVFAYDLFSIPVIDALVDLTLPLGEKSPRGFKPLGKVRRFWNSFPERFHDNVTTHLSEETINNKEMITVLMHTFIQKMVKDFELKRLKESANNVVNQLITRCPTDLHDTLHKGGSKDGGESAYTVDCLKKVMYNQSEEFKDDYKMLGIRFPESYNKELDKLKYTILDFVKMLSSYPDGYALKGEVIRALMQDDKSIDEDDINASLQSLLDDGRIECINEQGQIEVVYKFVKYI